MKKIYTNIKKYLSLNRFIQTLLVIILLILSKGALYSSENTVGLLKHTIGSADDGYVLFAPMSDTNTYLIDKCGYIVHKWHSKYKPGIVVYLLENGKLLRSGRYANPNFPNGGTGGYIEIINWQSEVEWSCKLFNDNETQHHDILMLPNGNILALVWEKKSKDDAIIAGMNGENVSKDVWNEKIYEIKPIGKDSFDIVWHWDLWKHLIQDYDMMRANYGKVEEHPELLDVNYFDGVPKQEIHHFNSLDYNEKYEQILISSRHFSEIYIIDHSTTKEESDEHYGGRWGRGGDILYRWGNPAAYRHGTKEDQILNLQHNAHWLKTDDTFDGSIMVFNNMNTKFESLYSSIDIFKPPYIENGAFENTLPFLPQERLWVYSETDGKKFYSMNLSSAQRLYNGNTLICNGADGKFFEIDKNNNIVWEYMNPVANNKIFNQGEIPKLTNNVFRCTFYKKDFSAFNGKDLSPIGTIENINTLSENCDLNTSVFENSEKYILDFDNEKGIFKFNMPLELRFISIYNLNGTLIKTYENLQNIEISDLVNGVYFVKLNLIDGKEIVKKININR